MSKKRKKVLLSSFSIILILIFGLGILSHVLPKAQFVDGTKTTTTEYVDGTKEEAETEEVQKIVDGSGTVGASLSQVLKAPILGFENAIDVGIFIMMLGGLLAVINKTKALDTGI